MFAAAGFTTSEIWHKADMKDVCDKINDVNNKKLGGRYNESIKKTKKQIQNYQQVTGELYKSIYERIKNHPDPKKTDERII